MQEPSFSVFKHINEHVARGLAIAPLAVMKILIRLQTLALASLPMVFGQPATSAEDRVVDWKFGGELDALSYVTKGFYGSFFAGRDGWRGRAIVSRVNVPGFVIPDGFDKRRVDAYVIAVDRFFGSKRKNLEGFWIGPGIEVWRNRVRREGFTEYRSFNNLVPTIGVGYVWKISKHFYVNPWAAGHVVAAGPRDLNISGRAYKQRVFTPEGSLKLGFIF